MKVLLFSIFSLFLVGCSYEDPDERKLKITSLVFNELLGHDSTWRNDKMLPVFGRLPGIILTKEYIHEHDQYLKSRDSLRQILDTITLTILVSDTIRYLYKDDKIEKHITYYKDDLDFYYDTTFKHLASKVSDLNNVRPINIRDIKSEYNYQIKKSIYLNSQSSEQGLIGRFAISEILFDDYYNKACVYAEIESENSIWSIGKVFFLVRKDSKWLIVGSRRLWSG